MNAPRADRVAAIATELGLLGRRLDALAAELSAWQPPVAPRPGGPGLDAPPPAPTVAAPPQPAWYGTVPGTPWPATPGRIAGCARRGGPAAESGWPLLGTRQPFPPAPLPPPAPRRPLRAWLASLSGARLLAWTGAGVTLLGVVLLLALAAARGWFAPPVRVAAGAVLGLALVGLGARLHRRPSSRTGALAVTGTGIATLYLVVAAATALYGYLPVPAGLLLALLVAAGGLALADRWKRGAARLRCGRRGGAARAGRHQRLEPAARRSRPGACRSRPPSWRCAGGGRCSLGIAAGWPVLYGTLVAGLAEPADRWGECRGLGRRAARGHRGRGVDRPAGAAAARAADRPGGGRAAAGVDLRRGRR